MARSPRRKAARKRDRGSGAKVARKPVSADEVLGWFQEAAAGNCYISLPSLTTCRILAGSYESIASSWRLEDHVVQSLISEVHRSALDLRRASEVLVKLDRGHELLTQIANPSYPDALAQFPFRVMADNLAALAETISRSCRKRPFLLWHFRARLLATIAAHGWKDRRRQKAPKSSGTEQPLNRFVQLALARIEGFERKPSAIQDALRRRVRGRRRARVPVEPDSIRRAPSRKRDRTGPK